MGLSNATRLPIPVAGVIAREILIRNSKIRVGVLTHLCPKMSQWITLGQTDSTKPLTVALKLLFRIFGAFFLLRLIKSPKDIFKTMLELSSEIPDCSVWPLLTIKGNPSEINSGFLH